MPSGRSGFGLRARCWEEGGHRMTRRRGGRIGGASVVTAWQRSGQGRRASGRPRASSPRPPARAAGPAARLFANLSVLRLSANASSAGDTMHIIVVLQLPPRLSSRMRVSLESRYGMCWRSLRSVRAAMTLPWGGGGAGRGEAGVLEGARASPMCACEPVKVRVCVCVHVRVCAHACATHKADPKSSRRATTPAVRRRPCSAPRVPCASGPNKNKATHPAPTATR
jgi:hypothetical protein